MYKNFDLFGLLKLLRLKQLNLLDTYIPFVLPALFGGGLRSGLFIYLFRQFYRGMPKELEDAAYVDGCTPVGAYIKIMFPNAVPAIVTVALFSFVWHWNDTFGPTMFLTNMKKYPLSLKMVNIVGMITQSSQISDLTYLIPTKYAGIAMAIFPLMILYIVGQKFFVENMDRSGIVG
jgi:carbohydrate ABC transporter membrane protein 2, CUT1 family (TC 3.A.1.1.-)